jgi:hypothetical protein
VGELHFITSVRNLASIATAGIRCHNDMLGLEHVSVADLEVQTIRATKRVPAKQQRLHDYTNLYFDARNAMMWILRQVKRRNDLVVLRVSPDVLDIAHTIVTDGNAASTTTRFYDPITQLELLDHSSIHAVSWNDPDPFVKAEKKRQRCAEVLVPQLVPPSMLTGCYVELPGHVAKCEADLLDVPVEVKPYVFFC